MTETLALVIVSQVSAWPAAREPALDLGSDAPTLFSVPPAKNGVASVAFLPFRNDAGSTGAVVWVDDRRSLATPPQAEPSFDLWSRFFRMRPDGGVALDQAQSIARGPPGALIDGPTLVFGANGSALLFQRSLGSSTVAVLTTRAFSADAGSTVAFAVPPGTKPSLASVGAFFVAAWRNGSHLVFGFSDGGTQAIDAGLVAEPQLTGLHDAGLLVAFATPGTGAWARDAVLANVDQSTWALSVLVRDNQGGPDVAGLVTTGSGETVATFVPPGSPRLYVGSSRINEGASYGHPVGWRTAGQADGIVSSFEVLASYPRVCAFSVQSRAFDCPRPPVAPVLIALGGFDTTAAGVDSADGGMLSLVRIDRVRDEVSLRSTPPFTISNRPGRFPSTVWSEQRQSFLLGFDEGGFRVPEGRVWEARLVELENDGGSSGSTLIFDAGAPLFTTLLGTADGTALAVKLELAGSTVVAPLIDTAGAMRVGGPFITRAGHWNASASGDFAVLFRSLASSFEYVTRTLNATEPGSAPSCVARFGNEQWLPSLEPNRQSLRFLVLRSDGSAGAFEVNATSASGAAPSVCARETPDGGSIVTAWADPPLIRVSSFARTPAGLTRQLNYGLDAGSMWVRSPLVSPTSQGVYVAWEDRDVRSEPIVRAAFVPFRGVDFWEIDLGQEGELASSPSLASAPHGGTLLAWQEFDVRERYGTVRVRSRLLSWRGDADAGGAGGDGGVMHDGGTIAPDPDGGWPDGSAASDAGSSERPHEADGGPVSDVVSFSPDGCGCTLPFPLTLPFVTVWMALLRRKERIRLGGRAKAC